MKAINKLEWKQETHLHVKENTYWEKQWHMNLCHEKQLFLWNLFIQRYQALQKGASARDCFPIQFTNSFLPLSGAFLYNPIARPAELKAITSHHQALPVQRVDYCHVLQIETNIMEMQRMIM